RRLEVRPEFEILNLRFRESRFPLKVRFARSSPSREQRTKMRKCSWYRLAGWAGLCALAFGLAGCNSQNPQAAGTEGQAGGRGMPITSPVGGPRAETRDLPVYLSGLGSGDAFNTVAVKSRIDGQLVDIRFREGQEVNKGDLRAVIAPRPYEVA